MREAEAANLIALGRAIAEHGERVLREGLRKVGRTAEHADLVIGIAQVRHFEHLRQILERETAVGTEEARAFDARFRIGDRIERVASVAGAHGVREPAAVRAAEVDVAAERLLGRQAVVEVAHRVGRQHHLQDELGERRHRRARKLLVPAQEARETRR